MVYYMPGEVVEQAAPREADLIPREIVAELDKYVVGQKAAKRAVAIALRNRTRRLKLSPEMAEEVAPKNIIMIGPTGVGKTEIARRLARLTSSPFLKVEASKYTEVGYVGRDVESMIRDLAELAVEMVRSEKVQEVRQRAARNVEMRLLDLLLPPLEGPAPGSSRGSHPPRAKSSTSAPARSSASSCAPARSRSAPSSWTCGRPPFRRCAFSPALEWRRWTSTSRT